MIVGPEASGKSEQSKRLALRWGGLRLSSGEIIRQYGSPEDQALMDKCDLIPSDHFETMTRSAIETIDRESNLILDGMAKRGINEVEMILKSLQDVGRSLELAIELKIDFVASQHRSASRAQETQPPRPDDAPGVQQARQDTFERETQPSLDYLKDLGILTSIDGNTDRDSVEQKIWHVITAKFPVS